MGRTGPGQRDSDGRPWVLVIAEHRTRRKLAVLDYATFLILYRAAFAPLGAGETRLWDACHDEVQVRLVMRTLELKGL